MDKTLETILYLIDTDERPQVNLAQYLNIPKSSISDWRSGKSCSYRKFIAQIALYYAVSADALIFGYAKNYTEYSPEFTPGKIPVISRLFDSGPAVTADNLLSFDFACYRFTNEFFGFLCEDSRCLYVIHRQNYADDGETVLIRKNGGIICTYSTHAENVILTPVNDPSSPMCFSEDYAREMIVGAVTEIRRKLK